MVGVHKPRGARSAPSDPLRRRRRTDAGSGAGTLRTMNRLEECRLAWQRAQAELQMSLAELEKAVASPSPKSAEIQQARDSVARRQRAADELLQRYITQIAKSG